MTSHTPHVLARLRAHEPAPPACHIADLCAPDYGRRSDALARLGDPSPNSEKLRGARPHNRRAVVAREIPRVPLPVEFPIIFAA